MMEVMSKRTMKRMTLLSDFSPSSKSQMLIVRIKGMPDTFNTDEFSEKFQTAFDPPPPHLRKIMLRIF